MTRRSFLRTAALFTAGVVLQLAPERTAALDDLRAEARRFAASFIIVGPGVAAQLGMPVAHPGSTCLIGELQGARVYCDPHAADNDVLLGYRGREWT